MHFKIHIDDETGAKLKDLAHKRKETLNALVRRAI
jgi:predicted transcriptional regulator